MLIALTRGVPSSIANCQLTHLDRVPIDVDVARAQHEEYERALESLGCTIVRITPTPASARVRISKGSDNSAPYRSKFAARCI